MEKKYPKHSFPPSPISAADGTFKFVEQMPCFLGCENESTDYKTIKSCADKKMLDFISSNLQYPDTAKAEGIEGTCVVQFIVIEDGSIIEPKILRDIGAGCGEEVLRIIELMQNMEQKWIPGKQDGKTVKVQFPIPIKFKAP